MAAEIRALRAELARVTEQRNILKNAEHFLQATTECHFLIQ